MLPRSLCHLNRILAFALVTISSLNASEPKGAEVPDLSAELPRIPRMEAGEALKTFQIAPGFTIEQIASEPLVNSPVAMCFDADGKLYVIEMRDYSEQDKEHLGQVRLLEDLDGDGVYDKSTVFADGLSWPTAIITSRIRQGMVSVTLRRKFSQGSAGQMCRGF
jgi:glucose/arabinose dehydrogenase